MSDIDGNDAMAAIPTFVLVHGAFQDATVWTAVIAEQEAAGHTATAVTLPGHRPDTTLPGQVTLANHRDAVLDVVRQQIGPVRLVGHSFGGIIISEVAEAEPALIEELVYVAAYPRISSPGSSATTSSAQPFSHPATTNRSARSTSRRALPTRGSAASPSDTSPPDGTAP